MIPILDYHIHTKLCGHAQGEPAEYIDYAIKIGLKEIGFSDHAPLVSHNDPTLTMNFSQLPEYHKMIEDVRKTYEEDIQVKIGIEADFIPGYENDTKAILENYPYDYVIGSVHYVNDWAFDHPHQIQQWEQKNVNDVYRNYYRLLRESASSGLFDIMAHVDLVKKFGHKPSEDLSDAVKETAEIFKRAGVAIEINTSGLRKPVREIYPSLKDLKIYCQSGVPCTFGSDAHSPEQVGWEFKQAVELALAAGYSEYVVFKNRKIEKTMPLSI